MTEEQINLMIELSAPLVTEPKPWSELTSEQRGVFQALMPDQSFTDEQRFWLGQWWLPVTEEQLAEINAGAPPFTVFEPRLAADGMRFLSADLLSDALADGPLANLLPILSSMPLTFTYTITWPPVPTPE